MNNDEAKLVTVGRGGCTIYINRQFKIIISGDLRDVKPDKDLIIPDGCPVVDTRPAVETPAGVAWAIRGPLVNPDLVDDAVEKCEKAPDYMQRAIGGVYGQALAIHDIVTKRDPNNPGPLDMVSVRDFVLGWKAHGARVGFYRNGVIEWAN